MQPKLNITTMEPTFLFKHLLLKTLAGTVAGFLAGKLYDKFVLVPSIQKHTEVI